MSELDTAAEALQQALQDDPVDGDAEASEQEGQESLKLAPKVQPKVDAAKKENADAKSARKSDKDWQEIKEAANEGKTLKEKLLAALLDAPEEVKTEDDPIEQIKQLRELVERKDWEESHPVVKSEKYAAEWKKVNEDPSTKHLDYDRKWKLIRDESEAVRGSKVKEELRNQDSDIVSVPFTSKGSVRSGSEASSLAQEYLKKAGFTDQQIAESGVKL